VARKRSNNGSRRRKFLAALGTGATISLTSGIASARRKQELPREEEVRKLLVDRYNEKAANAVFGISRKYWQQKERGNITQAEYHEQVTEELLDHPAGYIMAEDVQAAEAQDPRGNENTSAVESNHQSATDTQEPISEPGSVPSDNDDITTLSSNSPSDILVKDITGRDTYRSGGATASRNVVYECRESGAYGSCILEWIEK